MVDSGAVGAVSVGPLWHACIAIRPHYFIINVMIFILYLIIFITDVTKVLDTLDVFFEQTSTPTFSGHISVTIPPIKVVLSSKDA